MAPSTRSSPQLLFNEGGLLKKLTLLLALTAPISAAVCPIIDTSSSTQTHLESIDVSVHIGQEGRERVLVNPPAPVPAWNIGFFQDPTCRMVPSEPYRLGGTAVHPCTEYPPARYHVSWANMFQPAGQAAFKLCNYSTEDCAVGSAIVPAQVPDVLCIALKRALAFRVELNNGQNCP